MAKQKEPSRLTKTLAMGGGLYPGLPAKNLVPPMSAAREVATIIGGGMDIAAGRTPRQPPPGGPTHNLDTLRAKQAEAIAKARANPRLFWAPEALGTPQAQQHIAEVAASASGGAPPAGAASGGAPPAGAASGGAPPAGAASGGEPPAGAAGEGAALPPHLIPPTVPPAGHFAPPVNTQGVDPDVHSLYAYQQQHTPWGGKSTINISRPDFEDYNKGHREYYGDYRDLHFKVQQAKQQDWEDWKNRYNEYLKKEDDVRSYALGLHPQSPELRRLAAQGELYGRKTGEQVATTRPDITGTLRDEHGDLVFVGGNRPPDYHERQDVNVPDFHYRPTGTRDVSSTYYQPDLIDTTKQERSSPGSGRTSTRQMVKFVNPQNPTNHVNISNINTSNSLTDAIVWGGQNAPLAMLGSAFDNMNSGSQAYKELKNGGSWKIGNETYNGEFGTAYQRYIRTKYEKDPSAIPIVAGKRLYILIGGTIKFNPAIRDALFKLDKDWNARQRILTEINRVIERDFDKVWEANKSKIMSGVRRADPGKFFNKEDQRNAIYYGLLAGVANGGLGSRISLASFLQGIAFVAAGSVAPNANLRDSDDI